MEPGATGSTRPLFIDVFGTVRSIQPTSDRQRSGLAREWSRCLVDPPDGDVETLTIRPEHSDQVAGYALAGRLTRAGIRDLRGTYVLLHGCGLADKNGRALALVAKSGQGKTTAASVLGRAGLGYVTDETIAIHPDGHVLPYPKPLSVVDPGNPSGPKIQHSPDDMGLGEAPDDLRLGRIVLLDRDPERTAPPTVERLALLDALVTLIPESSSLYQLTRPLQALAILAAQSGGIYRLSYREISDAAPLLHDLMDTDADGDTWFTLAEDAPVPDDMLWALRDNRIRRRFYADAIRCGDEALVMVGAQPMRLSGLGLAIWEACRSGATFDDVLESVVRTLGDHPEACALVQQGLDDLREVALVDWGRPRTLSHVLTPQRIEAH